MSTAVELVQAVGKCYGVKVSNDEASYIIWNHTGWPAFWMTDRPIEEMRMQAAAYLRGERCCARCGTPVDPALEVCKLCLTCAEEMGWAE